MAALIGAVALSLAVIGLFGVTSLLVGQRTREIGVRMAIGATIADVRRQMLRDSLRPVAIGLTIGLSLALAGGQFLAAALYGVSGRDPLAIAAAVACSPSPPLPRSRCRSIASRGSIPRARFAPIETSQPAADGSFCNIPSRLSRDSRGFFAGTLRALRWGLSSSFRRRYGEEVSVLRIEERVAFLDGRVREQSDTMNDLREQFRALRDQMDRRFEHVDARFDAMDKRMSKQFMWLVGLMVTLQATTIASVAAMLAK